MRYYESLFIVNPNLGDESLKSLIESVKNEVLKLDGNVLNVEDWGKRKLAYRIEKQRYGNYVLIQFETENNKLVKTLESWMKLNQNILSYLTVRLKNMPPAGRTEKVIDEHENL